MSTIDKPCIRKCSLNEDEVCLGCYRTYTDMLAWTKASSVDKLEILYKAQERRKRYQTNR